MKKIIIFWLGLLVFAQLTTQCNKDGSDNEILQCTPLSFQIESENQLTYTFLADFPNIEKTAYSWLLDGELMELDGISGANILDNKFTIELTVGKHEICVIRDTECIGVSEKFCKTVTAKTSCPDLNYIQDGVFLKANFDGVNSQSNYIWTVNGEEKKIDGVAVNGNNKFDLRTLEPDTYKICIITPDCDTKTWYCSDVEIGKTICPRLYFKKSGNLLLADFENFENFGSYSWFVDGIETDKDGVSNKGDHLFDLESLKPGSYNICLQSESCEEVTIFCENVVIEKRADDECPSLSFSREGNILRANFKGFDSLNSYSWYVDDVEKDKDGISNKGDYQFDLKNLTPGTYTICIKSNDCKENADFCQKIVIKDDSDDECPSLSFERSGNLLQANFKGFDSLNSYSWYVDDVEKDKDGISNKGDYQFDLKSLNPGTYTICIKSNDCKESAFVCKEVIIEDDTVNECPSLSFERNGNLLRANFKGFDSLNSYSWYVDNVEKDKDGISNNGDYQFDLKSLNPGTYTICIKSNDCKENADFCTEVVIEDDTVNECPSLSFERNGNLLQANFKGFDALNSYSWYVDNVEKDKDGISNNGDYQFDLNNLNPGTYTICIKSNDCKENADFCTEVVIEDDTVDECPSLSFERNGNLLRANFKGFDSLNSYSWYVDTIERDSDGVDNNGDHQFSLENLNAGSYTICIKSNDCTENATFCKEITIKDDISQDCTRLSFKTEGTVAIANFSGAKTKGSYNWYVNGVLQELDGTSNNGDNKFDIKSFQSGTYSVCILPSNCEPENSFCMDMTVGNTKNVECPKLNFSKKGNKLNATFDGIKNHELYIWVVDGEEVKDDGKSVNGNNQLDISKFKKNREYKVCIYSPGCTVKNYTCRRITRR